MIQLTWWEPKTGQWLDLWVRTELILSVNGVAFGAAPDGANAFVCVAPEARIPEVSDPGLFVREMKEHIVGELKVLEGWA